MKYKPLLWSRKDIVRLCGSLVTHSGMSNGDTIGLIHLTIREFLSSSIESIRSYQPLEAILVDPSQARITAANTCLQLLSSKEIQDTKKSSPSGNLLTSTPTSLARFSREYPFLGYAVEFWPHYVSDTAINGLEKPAASNLIRHAESFLKARSGLLWLEYYMSQHGFEAASNTLGRFIEAFSVQDDAFSELLSLVTATRELLNSYSTAFCRVPQAVVKCLPDRATSLEVECEVRKCQDVMLLHTPKSKSVVRQGPKRRIHFNVDDESLFWLDDPISVRICLNRETIHGIKYRSATCGGEENLERKWEMLSAVVSPCGRNIATTSFKYKNYGNRDASTLFRTVLWLVR